MNRPPKPPLRTVQPFAAHYLDPEIPCREPEHPDAGRRAKARRRNQQVPQANSRNALADWMTDKKNPMFAKTAANRMWARTFGRGLVAPIDDWKKKTKAVHPELLKELGVDGLGLLLPVVDRRDQPAPKRAGPHPVGRRLSEHRVLLVRHPVREGVARVGLRHLLVAAARLGAAARIRVLWLAAWNLWVKVVRGKRLDGTEWWLRRAIHMRADTAPEIAAAFEGR